jgi:hypothetical protein
VDYLDEVSVEEQQRVLENAKREEVNTTAVSDDRI